MSGDGSSAGGTTRICVKNVPKHIDEKRLKEHFGSQGQVTDAKILRTKGGESRRMAFIGFRTDGEAKAALSFFNGTFLDTSRLIVEEAVARGASSLPRPWSKYSKGSSRFDESVEKSKRKRGGGAGDNNEQSDSDDEAEADDDEGETQDTNKKENKKRCVGKEEFFATMMPRSRTKFWANDDTGAVVDGAGIPATTAASDGKSGKKKTKENGGKLGRGRMASSDDDDEEEEHEMEVDDAEEEEEEEVAVPAKTKPTSDLDYLRSKVKKGLDMEIGEGEGGTSVSKKEVEAKGKGKKLVAEEEEEEEEEEEAEAAPKKAKSSSASNDEGRKQPKVKEGEQEEGEEGNGDGLDETGRLFLRNLPFATTEEDLMQELEQYGRVSEIHIPMDDAKRPKGFAFVTYILPEDAQKAMAALDGQAFQGRLLHVIPAKEPPKDPLADLDPSKARTYKERKEIERRQRAQDDRGWNASFMRSETVVDAVADRLNIEKGAVLDRDADGMAVKLALGETFLVAENREFFKKEGIDMSALEGAKGKKGGAAATARSKTTILVKNLPYSTTQDDLVKLFGKFGSLGRTLLPPSRSIGLVDFLEAADARRAFKGLAYKRFQHVPLYLEWAPLNVMGKAPATSGENGTGTAAAIPASDQKKEEHKPALAQAAPPVTATEEEDAEGSFTLFVKNLNFATTDDGLSKLFKQKTKGVRAVSIPKKTAPASKKNAAQQSTALSMGYGFVEYSTVALAREALRTMDGTLLDGHKLQCKLSDKRLTTRAAKLTGAAAKRTKLVVRNVPFQATIKELKELFGSFGKIKTARIPKKFDGSHRGFAFVEFLTAQEAANAYQALSATHLYGRHLVIEWAEDKDDIDTLREKAAKDVAKGRVPSSGGGGGATKKKKGDDFDAGGDDMDGF